MPASQSFMHAWPPHFSYASYATVPYMKVCKDRRARSIRVEWCTFYQWLIMAIANIKLNGRTGRWELEGFEGKEPE